MGLTNLLVIVMENLQTFFHVRKHSALTKREAKKRREREKLINQQHDSNVLDLFCFSPSSITGADSCVLPSNNPSNVCACTEHD